MKNFTKQNATPHKPTHIIVNLAIGGWIWPPDKTECFPAVMQVEYVRVWPQTP